MQFIHFSAKLPECLNLVLIDFGLLARELHYVSSVLLTGFQSGAHFSWKMITCIVENRVSTNAKTLNRDTMYVSF